MIQFEGTRLSDPFVSSKYENGRMAMPSVSFKLRKGPPKTVCQDGRGCRPINGLFRAPDVQSVERPPLRGLISLDIKPPPPGRGRAESEGDRLRLQDAGSLPIPPFPFVRPF